MKKICHKVKKAANKVFVLFVLFLTLSSAVQLYAQEVKPAASRQAAVDAFSKGMYKEALNGFTELLRIYTKDPLYKYYSGVCLVKLERDPLDAVVFLQQAYQGAGLARSVPEDVLFWLARAQQHAGQFSAAVNNYNQFSSQAGRKVSREYNVAEYIRECNERSGALTAITMEQKIEEALPAENPQPPGGKQAEENNLVTETKGDVKKDKLPAGYDRILREALDYQVKADSLQNLAVEKRLQMEGKNETQRVLLNREITAMEELAANWQQLADQRYNEARALVDKEVTGKDNIKTEPENKPAETVADRVQPVREPEPDLERPIPSTSLQKKEEVYSVFEIIGNAVYGAEDKMIIDPPIPEGLVYRIQLAVFRNPVEPSVFKGIEPVYGFKRAGTDLTIYYAGMFRRAADANKVVIAVRQMGFRDAFVVSLLGGNPVSQERAAILEKEWGGVSLIKKVPEEVKEVDTSEPPTLSFRVEALRSDKPLKDDMGEKLKTIAGTRGLDIYSTEDGKTAYLIGKFITFESALGYADLLVRNGYREARVTAWLGTREIDLDVARKLFERPE